ncbi:MAG: FAD-dependent oxidoreductase [Phycisphaerae bacterium]|nr:FAD-dependent oxidoreductase [Gemmatimonadaceae bacterium]
MKFDADVIVLGAGLAGLGAAKTLGDAGRSVIVLEARHRTGGRVHTVRDAATNYPIELGPEWVGAEGVFRDLLNSVHADVRPTHGIHLVRRNGEMLARENFDETIEIMERVRALITDGSDLTLSDALDRSCPEPEFAESRAALLGYVQGFHAADPARVSARWLLEVEENEPAGASEGHALAGLDTAINALGREQASTVSFRFDTVAQTVHWSDGSVEVTASSDAGTERFSASSLVCALPLAVLKLTATELGAVQFSPPLTTKERALRWLDTGEVVKVVLVFDEPFWTRQESLGNVSFLQQPGLPFPTWWTTHPVAAPVLTGWVAGPLVAGLGGVRGEGLLPLALESLSSVLGLPLERVTQHLRGWHTHDWGADPFARGGYSYVLSGGTGAHRELAQPINNTLFFAGEATCGLGHNATMEGALQSGLRAAQELLACR